MRTTSRTCSALAVGFVLAFSWFAAKAQSPNPMKVIVTFPPRSGGDILTRAVAEQVSRSHGAPTSVENQAAAAGTEAVVHAPPDGNTLLVINNNFVADSNFRKLTYDPLVDLQPICSLATAQTLLVVSGSSPYHTLKDLIDTARQRPSQITYSANAGSTVHLGMEALKRAAGVDMTFVPVPGLASTVGVTPPLEAVLDGRAVWSIQTFQNSREHFASNKLRPLAAASRRRLEALPDLPTIAESGYKEFDVDLWDGIFAPANTPKDRVSQLAEWFGTAMRAPEVRSKIGSEAFLPVGVCGPDFVALIQKQHEDYGRTIREANIKLQ